jgi:hypothetical protein
VPLHRYTHPCARERESGSFLKLIGFVSKVDSFKLIVVDSNIGGGLEVGVEGSFLGSGLRESVRGTPVVSI